MWRNFLTNHMVKLIAWPSLSLLMCRIAAKSHSTSTQYRLLRRLTFKIDYLYILRSEWLLILKDFYSGKYYYDASYTANAPIQAL